eukprot:scaffold7523_cov132-Isochrysis_galbana.AAC.5
MTAALTSTRPSSSTVTRQSRSSERARSRSRWARMARTGGGDSNLTCRAHSTDSNSCPSMTPRLRVSSASKQRATYRWAGRVAEAERARSCCTSASLPSSPSQPCSSASARRLPNPVTLPHSCHARTCHVVRSGRILDSSGAKRESGMSVEDSAPSAPACSHPCTSWAKAAASAFLRLRVRANASVRMCASYDR